MEATLTGGAADGRRRRILTAAALALLLLVTTTACGDEGGDVARTGAGDTASSTLSDGTTPGTADTAPPGTDEAGDAVDPLADAGLDDAEGTATASGTSLLSDVRVAGQAGYDRVVFEFRGEGVPGWQVGYVDPPILSDGEGAEVDVAGGAFLEVRLTPASGVDLSEDFEEVYTGSDRVDGDTAAVTEVVRTGDFEAVLTWVIGVEAEAPFAVSTLADPSRLVVDLAVP